jgi:hypothetical protein
MAVPLTAGAASAPAAPTGLQATLGAGAVQLTWQDASTDEALFSIESCWGAGCVAFRQIATVGAGVTSYLDPTYDAGVNRYRVAAVNAAGASYSEVAEITLLGTEEPTASFTATPTSGLAPLTVTFDGTASAAFGGGLVDSWVWSFGDGSAASGAIVTHTFMQPGSYTVVLTVQAGFARDATSRVITVSPGLVAPTSLVATAPARGRVVLTWVNLPSTATSLAVQRCTGAGCSSFATLATTAASASSFTDTTVRRRKSYTYRLLASDGAATVASTTATVVSR